MDFLYISVTELLFLSLDTHYLLYNYEKPPKRGAVSYKTSPRFV